MIQMAKREKQKEREKMKVKVDEKQGTTGREHNSIIEGVTVGLNYCFNLARPVIKSPVIIRPARGG